MYRRLSAPINVQWEITSTCNLHCVHCYNFWRGAGGSLDRRVSDEQMPLPELVVNELISNGIFHVTITGGEPLIAMNNKREALIRLRDAGIDLNLNSNLSLLDNERMELLKTIGFKSVLTSLMASDGIAHDALSGVVGSFDKTCAGIRKLIECGLPVAINMVVTKRNLPLIHETGRFAKAIGAVGFCATKASRPASCADFSEFQLSRKDLQELFLELVKVHNETGINVDSLEHYPACSFPDSETRSLIGSRNCSAGKSGCTIGFDGLVRPCSHAKVTYGNISQGLSSAWVAMDEWRKGVLVPERCKKQCSEFPLRCNGGCRVESENCGNTICGQDPYCVGGGSPARQPKLQQAFDVTSTFISTNNLRFRRESVGVIAYSSSKNWLLVDDEIASRLKSADAFRATDLAVAYGIDVKRVHSTLRLLVSKKLVNVGGRESE